MQQQKEEQMHDWAAVMLRTQKENLRLEPLSGDASFRKYFRCWVGESSYLLALAPPDTEKNYEFVMIAQMLNHAGIHAPEVMAVDYEHGFILQSDLGDRLLMAVLNDETVDELYKKSMDMLLSMVSIDKEALRLLPEYNEQALMLELSYFSEWFVKGLLSYDLAPDEESMLQTFFNELVESAKAQPQFFVHRDFHCRNIMVLEDGQLATIDFQDGVVGPITYDLVSLLRDCYVVWPDQRVRQWVNRYWYILTTKGITDVSEEVFQNWFDLMGLQRHIKVLGIFARLSIRDGKHGYLADLPTVVRYVIQVAELHPSAGDFLVWFNKNLLPLIRQQSWGEDV